MLVALRTYPGDAAVAQWQRFSLAVPYATFHGHCAAGGAAVPIIPLMCTRI